MRFGMVRSPRCFLWAKIVFYAQRGILVYILWPLRRNTSEYLKDYYRGKVEDLLTPRIRNYDF